MNPERILARGYAIVRQDTKVLHAPADVLPNVPILVQLHKGTLEVVLRGKEDMDDETQTSLEFS